MNLTQFNDAEAIITKQAVVDYMRQLANDKIRERELVISLTSSIAKLSIIAH